MSGLRWSVIVGGMEVARFRYRDAARGCANAWHHRQPKVAPLSVSLVKRWGRGVSFIYPGRALKPGEMP